MNGVFINPASNKVEYDSAIKLFGKRVEPVYIAGWKGIKLDIHPSSCNHENFPTCFEYQTFIDNKFKTLLGPVSETLICAPFLDCETVVLAL